MSLERTLQHLTETLGTRLAADDHDRRSFLLRVTAATAAFAAAPVRTLIMAPEAEAAGCRRPGGCRKGLCRDGYSAFCCTLNGRNRCPPGTHPGGWWYAHIQTGYCATGKRYYIDCIGNCRSNCSACRCAGRKCRNRRVCCNTGYTNCGGSPRAILRCRIIRCANPCTLFASCSCSGGKDQGTCRHGAGPGCHAAPRICRDRVYR